jgi:hypothetical protein
MSTGVNSGQASPMQIFGGIQISIVDHATLLTDIRPICQVNLGLMCPHAEHCFIFLRMKTFC